MFVKTLIPAAAIVLLLHSPCSTIEAQTTGEIANRSVSYPFFAAVHWSPTWTNYSSDDVACSAGILSAWKVLTTCSCIMLSQDESRPALDVSNVTPTTYYVSVGIGQTGSPVNSSAVTVKQVAKINHHPNCKFDRGTRLWYGDLTFLTLKDRIEFNPRIQPMPVPRYNMFKASRKFEELANSRSLSCVALAWSRTSPRLVALDVELLAMSDCVDHCSSYVEPLLCLIRNRVSGFMIKSARPLNGSTFFTGGPLVCNGTVWAMVNLRWSCSQGLYHQITSPAEVIFAKNDFDVSIFRRNMSMMVAED